MLSDMKAIAHAVYQRINMVRADRKHFDGWVYRINLVFAVADREFHCRRGRWIITKARRNRWQNCPARMLCSLNVSARDRAEYSIQRFIRRRGNRQLKSSMRRPALKLF